MNSVLTINDVARRKPAASTAHGLRSPLPFHSLLLTGESRADLEGLLRSSIDEFRPASPAEFCLVNEIVATRWRLARLERGHTRNVIHLSTCRNERNRLVWNLHRSIVAFRRQRRHSSPTDPQPPALAKIVAINSQNSDEPPAPDRRRPHEPTLPGWLPLAA